MKAKAVEIEKLTRRFGSLAAVDRISLSIGEGEIFGLLGPNGAGKTTTIKMLSTMLQITSGSARVCGLDVKERPDDVRRCIGIVFQDPAVDVELTGRENLDFHARLYGMGRSEREKRILEALRIVGMEDKANTLVGKYSGGMKRRLEIARGLMHYPKVLFLDEPTLGLDAQTRRVIWDHIKRINREEKVTIILTTHYMEEADYLCNRVAIMDQGKILASGSPARLKSSIGADVIYIRASDPGAFRKSLASQGWVKKAAVYDGHLCISLKDGETRIPQIIRLSEKAGISVTSIELKKPTLEDVFIRYTGRKIRDEEADGTDTMRLEARMRGRAG
jgi:ABC-2 type transport system ATP-binding protein